MHKPELERSADAETLTDRHPRWRAVTVGALALAAFWCTPDAQAYDNGAQVIGCDFRLGKEEGTDRCLIVGSGMNQGIGWVVFEVQGRRFRFEDDAPDVIETVSKSGDTLARAQGRNQRMQCRPGGREADAYLFANGDRVCLYWP